MLRGCEAGNWLHRSLGEPPWRGIFAAGKNAETDFHRCGASQERPRQSVARPPAGGLDRAHEGVRMSIGSVFAAIAFAFVSATSLHAEDLWRHGTLVPKGDAGFIYMAAEGGFAKAEGLDLKMQAFQNDTLLMKSL